MFDIIKQQVSLLSELEKDLGITFRQMGDKNWVIDGDTSVESCPFCGHHGCFRVMQILGENSTGFYKCFSCDEHGDVITWRSKQKKIDLAEAAKELAREHGIRISSESNPIQQVFTLAANYYHQCLIETCDKPQAIFENLTPLEYQTTIRKHKLETLTKHKIGFSDGGLYLYLDSLGIDKAILEQSGLINKKTGKDYLPASCFIYPHFVKGRASHFTFKDPTKRIQYQLPKKYSLNGYLFYGQDSFLESSQVVLVEGENDRLSVIESGIPFCTAIIGQISGEQLDWLRENGRNKHVLTIFDPDDAGDLYREKVEVLRKFFGDLKHVRPSEDKDVDKHISDGKSFKEVISGNFITVKPKPRVNSKPENILPWEEILELSGGNDPDLQEAFSKNDIEDAVITKEPETSKYVPPVIPTGEKSVQVSMAPSVIDPDEETELEITDCPIVQVRGVYVRCSWKDGVETRTPVSNFTIELKNIYENESDQRMREILVRRFDGHKSRPFLMTSEEKVNVKAFKLKMANVLDVEWRGTQADLDNMWNLVYNQFPDVVVKTTRQAGRSQKHACWMFKNILITDSGVTLKPDENDIFWVNNNQSGLKIEDIDISGATNGIPSLQYELSREETDVLLKRFIEGLSKNLREIGHVLIALGWVYSNVYSDAIFKAHGGMGMLMFWGIGGQGKSTIARWLQGFFGLDEKMASGSIPQLGTGKGFIRKGGYYSSIPMFLDELRADENSDKWLGLIRSWYDREGRALSNKDDFGVRNERLSSTLIIAGEDLPSDPATKERCIMIRVPPVDVTHPNMVANFATMENEITPHLSNVLYYWILDSCNVNQKDIISGIRKLDTDLVAAGCSNRISKVWASAAYFSKQLADKYCPEYDFMEYLIKTCVHEHKQQKSESTLSDFFGDMETTHSKDHSPLDSRNIMRDGDLVHIWFPSVYNEVMEHRVDKKSRTWSKSMISRAIKEEPYFVSDTKKVAMGLQGMRRVVITLDLKKAPAPICTIVGYEREDLVKPEQEKEPVSSNSSLTGVEIK
jgi:5S rRNA maturation endonuclease (ribonuclease M5)